MIEATKERIEQELENELGFRWTPQMRHGYKALKLWNGLVAARAEIERLNEALECTSAPTAEHDTEPTTAG